MKKEESKNSIATQEEIASYLTSVVRGSAVSEVLVTEKGQKVCMTKSPDEKEKIRAAQLLYQQLTDKSECNFSNEESEFIDDIGYEN